MAGQTSQFVNVKCTDRKDKFYPNPLNFFKIVHTIFGVIILQDFVAPSLQTDELDLVWPVSSGKWNALLVFVILSVTFSYLLFAFALFIRRKCWQAFRTE